MYLLEDSKQLLFIYAALEACKAFHRHARRAQTKPQTNKSSREEKEEQNFSSQCCQSVTQCPTSATSAQVLFYLQLLDLFQHRPDQSRATSGRKGISAGRAKGKFRGGQQSENQTGVGWEGFKAPPVLWPGLGPSSVLQAFPVPVSAPKIEVSRIPTLHLCHNANEESLFFYYFSLPSPLNSSRSPPHCLQPTNAEQNSGQNPFLFLGRS